MDKIQKNLLSELCEKRSRHCWKRISYFLVHLSRRLKCTIVVRRCPLSVIRCPTSDVRPSVVNFHILTSHLKPLNRIQRNLIGSKISTSSTKCCVFRADRKKQDGRPELWLPETLLTSSLELLKGIRWNLTGSKISMCFTKFVFFGPIGKPRWPPLSLIGWDFSTSPLKPQNRIRRNLTGSKISRFYTKFVFFGPIGKNKMAALASDLLRHFWLLLWNRWKEFYETWQEERYQRPLPSLCFSGWSENLRWPSWPLICGDTFITTLDYIVAQQTKTTHWLINI